MLALPALGYLVVNFRHSFLANSLDDRFDEQSGSFTIDRLIFC